MACAVGALMCAALLSTEVEPGGWLFVSVPAQALPADGRFHPVPAVIALVEGARVRAYALHTTVKEEGDWWSVSAIGTHWVIAVRAPEGDAGPHTLTVITGGEEWLVDYQLRVWTVEHWLSTTTVYGWWDSGRPQMHVAIGEPRSEVLGYVSLDFPIIDAGLILWRPDGSLIRVQDETRVYLRRGDGTSHVLPASSHWWPDWTPIVVRPIRSDGSLGPAWHVDDRLVLADEPEVEDGRYELLNPDDTVRWRSDAYP